MQTDQSLLKLVQVDLKQLFFDTFQPIGFKLIVSLCTNFTRNSYFHLLSTISKIELHQRLIALNMMVVCLSTRSLPQSTQLGTLLFNNHRRMPESYVHHIQSVCLLGFIINDPIATQMIDVKTRVQERLNVGQIQRQRSFLFQCSQECRWIFHFEDCGVPNSRSRCPLCKKDIGAERYAVLIARNPPQIQLTIDQGFQIIDEYLNAFNQQVRVGYYNTKSADQSGFGEKSDHLNRPISFRFIHMLTNAQLLVLFELGYLSIDNLQRQMNITNQRHFHEHFEKDYQLLTKSCTDPDQCYIWLYKLINHMLSPTLIKQGQLNTQMKVINMEQTIEQTIIFPHIVSFTDEINQYRLAYIEFIRERNSQAHFTDYLEELRENNRIYPLLNFFNCSRIITVNPLDEFRVKMETLPFSNKLYPITTFLLQRLNHYANIQHIYPIVELTNYLLHKYNHRIKRNDAVSKTIEECLNDTKTDQQQTMKILLNQFIHAWYKLDLKEVQVGCQRPAVDRPMNAANFAQDTSLATLLVKPKDANCLLVLAYLHTLSKMQNEIIGYFSNMILNQTTKNVSIPVQAIKAEHVFRFDANDLSTKLVRDGFVINFEYGKGRDLIYDYEEIEITLRNLVSCLYSLDCDNLHSFHYQFELYAENTSLITQIRQRIRQQPLPANERLKLSKLLVNMNDDEIIHFMGSLDYLFTYLCNINENETDETLQTFVEKHIERQDCLNEYIFRRPPFSTISLVYIIVLYELMEEIAFDKVLRTYVKTELRDIQLTDDVTFDRFIAQTYAKVGIPKVLQSSVAWIGTLKRLLVRVLNASTIHLDTPLQYYLARIDLWSSDVTEDDLESIELDEAFLLRHTYILLCELESREKRVNQVESEITTKQAIPSVEEQRTMARTWHTTNSTAGDRKIVLSKQWLQEMKRNYVFKNQ